MCGRPNFRKASARCAKKKRRKWEGVGLRRVTVFSWVHFKGAMKEKDGLINLSFVFFPRSLGITQRQVGWAYVQSIFQGFDLDHHLLVRLALAAGTTGPGVHERQLAVRLAEGAPRADQGHAARANLALIDVVLLNDLEADKDVEDGPHGAKAGHNANGAVAGVDLAGVDGGPLAAHLAPGAEDGVAAAGLVVEAAAETGFPGHGHDYGRMVGV